MGISQMTLTPSDLIRSKLEVTLFKSPALLYALRLTSYITMFSVSGTTNGIIGSGSGITTGGLSFFAQEVKAKARTIKVMMVVLS